MRARRRATATLAVLLAAATLGACGGSDSADESVPAEGASAAATATSPGTAGGGPQAAAYREDVATAQRSLVGFATTLRELQSPEDLTGSLGDLERDLDAFDGAVAGLDGHALDSAALREERAALLRTGPPVSDVLRRFLGAAAEEDIAAVQGLVPEVQRALTDWQAASGSGVP